MKLISVTGKLPEHILKHTRHLADGRGHLPCSNCGGHVFRGKQSCQTHGGAVITADSMYVTYSTQKFSLTIAEEQSLHIGQMCD